MRSPKFKGEYCSGLCPYLVKHPFGCLAYESIESFDSATTLRAVPHEKVMMPSAVVPRGEVMVPERCDECIHEWGFGGGVHERPGHDRLWDWFGLSYSSFITIPRVLAHAMPDVWQRKMAELLDEYEFEWDFTGINLGTRVQVTENKRLVKTPEWLINYRHPDMEFIENLRVKKARTK